MKAPAFWLDPDAFAGRLLAPLGWIYAETTAWRVAHGERWRAPVPVICVGNLTAGGAGKTPVVRDIAARLTGKACRPHVLSRGYGGRQHGPLLVDPLHHRAVDVGDESLLLARDVPSWVSADRADGARAIVAAGAHAIIMDDGLQNPSLVQDLRLVVVDGETGFGNGRAIPAGPLRERVADGMARADAVILLGPDRHGLVARFAGRIPVLQARLEAAAPERLRGRKLAAFAGIGRPEKFRETLLSAEAEIAVFQSFPDHHPYVESELDVLARDAAGAGADLVTTEKDWIRLDPAWRTRVKAVPVTLIWQDETQIEALLARIAAGG